LAVAAGGYHWYQSNDTAEADKPLTATVQPGD
jgi:hypothetical protein